MKLEDELRKAQEARRLLESDHFKEARAHVAETLATARRKAPLTATEMHTRLIMMEQVAAQFFGWFDQCALTGKMAQLQLAQAEQQQKSYLEGLKSFMTGGRNRI